MGRKKKPITGYGEGTIFFSNTQNKWMGQINIGRGDDGKMKRKTVYGKTAEEVKSKLQQVRFDIYTGDFVHPSSITFEQLEKQVLDDKLAMNEIQEQTYHRHMETLKRLASINKQPLQKINYSMLKHLMLSLVDDYADSTIRKIYMMLNQCFNEAVKRKIISENPMGDLKRPKSRKKGKVVRALTIEEQIKLTNVLVEHKPTYWEQMLISLYTGMRMGEVNDLTYNDINLDFGFIFVCKTVTHDEHERPYINHKPKTDAGKRQLPINNTIKSLIIELKSRQTEENGDELIFHPKLYSHLNKDKIVSTSTVNDTFKRILKKYDILDKSMVGAVSLHSLRHTYATRCVEANISVKVLQVLLGHTEIETTLDIYTTIFPDYKDSSVTIVDDYLNNLNLFEKPLK